jgi:hypothetical protein
LRLKRKERVVVYMTPQAGQFLVGVVLGEKAVDQARQHALPDAVIALIDGAPRYAEGRGVRLVVGAADALATARQLVAIKMSGT